MARGIAADVHAEVVRQRDKAQTERAELELEARGLRRSLKAVQAQPQVVRVRHQIPAWQIRHAIVSQLLDLAGGEALDVTEILAQAKEIAAWVEPHSHDTSETPEEEALGDASA